MASLVTNKLIIIIMVLLVTSSTMIFIFKPDILSWVGNLPEYTSSEQQDRIIEGMEEKLEVCEEDESLVGWIKNNYIYINDVEGFTLTNLKIVIEDAKKKMYLWKPGEDKEDALYVGKIDSSTSVIDFDRKDPFNSLDGDIIKKFEDNIAWDYRGIFSSFVVEKNLQDSIIRKKEYICRSEISDIEFERKSKCTSWSPSITNDKTEDDSAKISLFNISYQDNPTSPVIEKNLLKENTLEFVIGEEYGIHFSFHNKTSNYHLPCCYLIKAGSKEVCRGYASSIVCNTQFEDSQDGKQLRLYLGLPWNQKSYLRKINLKEKGTKKEYSNGRIINNDNFKRELNNAREGDILYILFESDNGYYIEDEAYMKLTEFAVKKKGEDGGDSEVYTRRWIKRKKYWVQLDCSYVGMDLEKEDIERTFRKTLDSCSWPDKAEIEDTKTEKIY